MITHIFKYEIPITDEIIEMELPEYFILCDIQCVNNKIYMWGMIDIHAELVKRFFKIIGTGLQIKEVGDLLFLKTIIMPNGLVWHIFSVTTHKYLEVINHDK